MIISYKNINKNYVTKYNLLVENYLLDVIKDVKNKDTFTNSSVQLIRFGFYKINLVN